MKKILKIVFSLVFIISAGYSYSIGEEPSPKDAVITIYMGEFKVINVDNPTKIVITNPNVADVTSVTKGEMVIVAKGAGTTGLIWQDNLGEHVSQIDVLLENMSPVKSRVDSILKELGLPDAFTRTVDSEGKVLLLGSVKTPQDIERVSQVLGSLKSKIINLLQVKEEETVVGIDVQVLELNKDATATLGFGWPGTATITEVGSPAIAAAGTQWGNLFRVVNVSRAAFTLTLDALVQEGKARVLSQPRLSCQSGKEAELLVGGEKPVLTTTIASSTGGSGTNVEYKEFGIKLKIKPTVTKDKDIKLALNVEVSEVGAAETLGSATVITAKAYPLSKRNASTELFLKDGQTMAIGGLKKQKSEEDIRKTPFLGDIPILGLAFRRKTTKEGSGQGERGDVELFITLTPTILKESAETKEKTGAAAFTQEEASAAKGESGPEGAQLQPNPQTPISPLSEYIGEVSRKISNNIVYPWAAEEAKVEGTLKLALHIYYTGQLLAVEIRESSGYAVLDENAVNAVKRIAPYPPFSPEMKQRELWVDLPIVFKSK